jgi:hypothetical protein
MVVNPGLNLPKQKSRLKWVFLIILLLGIFFLIFSGILIRWFVLHKVDVVTIIQNVSIVNDTAISLIASNLASSAESSLDSRFYSSQNSYNSYALSSSMSSQSSSLASFINNVWGTSSIITLTTSEIPTTTLNYDYTSYEMKVPMKFKYCNPTYRHGENGTIIPPDTCIVINESCCPCYTMGMVDGVLKKVAWGGRVTAINSKYYPEPYFTTWLKNCTGFGVVCRMANTGAGCDYTAACLNGKCTLVSRF